MTTRLIPFTPNNFRRFVVGSMLQTMRLPSTTWVPSAQPPPDAAAKLNDDVLAAAQQRLAQQWRVEQQPFDAASTRAFYQRLGEFAVGAKPLPTEILDTLRETFGFNRGDGGAAATARDTATRQQQAVLRAAFDSVLASSSREFALAQPAAQASAGAPSLATAAGMRAVLQLCGFLRPGDNLHRLVAGHRIELPDAVHRFVDDHEVVERDPFDGMRVTHTHNVFAIDSATTSEVDDAIGIRVDESGNEVITVYVADATVHCPIFSELEQFSARQLTTTTYLPEGVFFMLPDRITAAATLRPDRPCRTFNVNFRVDRETGELFDYSVDVGWCNALRRVTYDDVQALLETRSTVPLASSPTWLKADDVAVLQRIHEIAVLRYNARMKRCKGFTGSMPDPLIIVERGGTQVLDVRDQIICTKDARLAVAELMIAANEVCSRVAQAGKVVLPFRGSRPLSSFHEAAAEGELVPPALGHSPLPSQEAGVSFFARTLVADMDKLRGVTRAYYAHFPVYHNGLDTHHYCHSTSPLRRYPDMLVHHQLKTLLARTRRADGGAGGAVAGAGARAGGTAAVVPSADDIDFIPEPDMVRLCASCSSIQQKGKVMQMRSDRFWVLSFLEQRWRRECAAAAATATASGASSPPPLLLRCYVGATEYIRASQETDRERSAQFAFRSDVFIPDVQLVHSVYHNRADMLAGVTALCRVTALDPYLDRLVLVVDSVTYEPELQKKLAQMVALLADA